MLLVSKTMVNYKHTIKVIGFDLDQTLYQKSPEIDQAIQKYIYQKIAEHIQCSLEQAQKMFKELYRDGKGLSGKQTLAKLGVPHGDNIVQEALERADIDRFLVPNSSTLELLHAVKKQYQGIDLITGSGRHQVQSKLEKLLIPEIIFDHILDATIPEVSKSDGSAYRTWMNFYPLYKPEEFLYIGDRASSDHLIPKEFGIQTILVNIKKKDPALACLQLESLVLLEGYLI